MVWYYSFT